MLQSLPFSHSYPLNPMSNAQTVPTQAPFNIRNQSLLNNTGYPPMLMPINTAAFVPQVSMLTGSSATSPPNFVFNKKQIQTENQQNLVCMNNNDMSGNNGLFMNNNYPINLVNNQQTNNMSGFSNQYLSGQNEHLIQSTDNSQNLLQLQAMNMKYKQIIQQQQEQLKNMQFHQLNQTQIINQEPQAMNQIYPQVHSLPLNSFSTTSQPSQNDPSRMSFPVFQNQHNAAATKSNFLTQYPQLSNPQQRTFIDELPNSMKLLADMTKVKIEMVNQQQLQYNQYQQQYQQQQIQLQQQQQQEIVCDLQAKQQQNQQYQQLQQNCRQESQSIITTQSYLNNNYNNYNNNNNNNNGDTLSQSHANQLENSQYSFQTQKTQNNHCIQRQYSFDTNQKLQMQLSTKSNSNVLTSLSNSNTKLDEDYHFEALEQYQNPSQKSNNYMPNSENNKNSTTTIISHQTKINEGGDNLSYSSFASLESFQRKTEIQDQVFKKRFMNIKLEEEQQQQQKSITNDIKTINIPQANNFKTSSPTFKIASPSPSLVTDQKNSIVLSSDNQAKIDQDYLEFTRMSSFDNLQEASLSFDKVLLKLSVNQTVDLILSTLPQKPEELTNFENKFVNSMKAKQSKDKRNPNALYMTRFHNLTRLLMYNIVQLFSFDILSQNLNIHFYIAQELENICRKIKNHARQTCNGQFKTDFYTHSHYNGLFLVIDKETLSHIQKQQKDIEIHQQVFGVDLQNVQVTEESLDFGVKKCNFFKILAYEILMKCSQQIQDLTQNNGDDARRIYFRRALSGISKLNKGKIVHRF